MEEIATVKGIGREGKLLGVFDDDFRTPLHYTHRLSEVLRKSLGDASMKFIDVRIVRVSSEDVCLVTCQKSDDPVLCHHQQYNKHMGRPSGESLSYNRINAMTVLKEEWIRGVICKALITKPVETILKRLTPSKI